MPHGFQRTAKVIVTAAPPPPPGYGDAASGPTTAGVVGLACMSPSVREGTPGRHCRLDVLRKSTRACVYLNPLSAFAARRRWREADSGQSSAGSTTHDGPGPGPRRQHPHRCLHFREMPTEGDHSTQNKARRIWAMVCCVPFVMGGAHACAPKKNTCFGRAGRQRAGAAGVRDNRKETSVPFHWPSHPHHGPVNAGAPTAWVAQIPSECADSQDR